ncbi:MAG: TauD/TfdA family dioxygenase [Flavobacteriaceae bacterium]
MIDANTNLSEYKIIGVHPMTGNLGAEVSNVDLDQLDDKTFAEIKKAFLEYQVIVFRDQNVKYKSHIDFGKRFGDLYIHPYISPIEEYPELIRLLKKPTDKVNNGGTWHFDLTFVDEPPMCSILRLIDVPKTGGDTMFCNMYSAYDALSDSMKIYLEGLQGVHTSAQLFGPTGYYTINKKATSMAQIPDVGSFVALHPLVRTHPETGRKCLFVNPGYIERIYNIPNRESDHILNFLNLHCAQAEFSTRVKWEKDTITMWDNRCAMHHAINDYQGQRREGVRVTVSGGQPV